jgi:polar amino acid transport system ATP-binding protein
MVQSEGVRKAFGSTEVLRGIDLRVDPGEVLCVIGPSGSGKSTFLRCINHLEKIDAGRLYVDGEPVGYEQRGTKLYELKDREICRKRAEIGMVFQRFNLFAHMTVLESGRWEPVEVWTPQGSGISPILANVFLHYVVDLWVHHWRRHRAAGQIIVCR